MVDVTLAVLGLGGAVMFGVILLLMVHIHQLVGIVKSQRDRGEDVDRFNKWFDEAELDGCQRHIAYEAWIARV